MMQELIVIEKSDPLISFVMKRLILYLMIMQSHWTHLGILMRGAEYLGWLCLMLSMVSVFLYWTIHFECFGFSQ
jgi:hypothetical protein